MAGTTTPPAGTGTTPKATPAPKVAQQATVIGHKTETTIKDTNKSLGSPRALMHVPAARKH
jgi:hypothetical protein